MDSELKPLTPAEWRAAMGYFPTGVTIVTSWQDAKPVGSTINAFCSVSLEPPMLLICLDRSNPLRGPIEQSGVFGVNILGAEEGHALALRFSRDPDMDRFRDCAYHADGDGAPQLDAAPVFIDCVLENSYPAGDHFVTIGRAIRTRHLSDTAPLLYHRGRFPRFPGATGGK